ncbi:MAG: holo-ACP synthase [Vulcanimicrobiota bacterium]
MIKGIGIDVVKIPKIEQSINDYSERFLNRIYTEREVEYCRARGNPVIHYAGTFAAKEAAYKSISTVIDVLRWKEIEVCRTPEGRPWIALHGLTFDLCEKAGIGEILISISHSEDVAVAQCIAVSETRQ